MSPEVFSDEPRSVCGTRSPSTSPCSFERHCITASRTRASSPTRASRCRKAWTPWPTGALQPLGEELVCPRWFNVRLDPLRRPEAETRRYLERSGGPGPRAREAGFAGVPFPEPAWCYELGPGPGGARRCGGGPRMAVPHDLNWAYTRLAQRLLDGNWSRLYELAHLLPR